MTKREKVLLKILLLISTLVLFYLSYKYFADGINENLQNKDRYEKLIEKVKITRFQTEEEFAVQQIICDSEKVERMTMSELLESILYELKTCGIRPERYQINSKGKNEYVDFNIKCSSSQFVNYLSKKADISYPYKMSSISIKTEEEGLSAQIRYELILEKVLNSDFKKERNSVQTILRSPYRPPKEIPVIEREVTIEEPVKENIIDGSDMYKIIGYIKDNSGVNNLYIKSETGRMIKISPENIVEEDSEQYILLIDNKKTKINRVVK